MLRAELTHEIGRCVELFAAHAVVALIDALVQVAVGCAGPPEALHGGDVALIGAGADESR
jgi:hypothetical protein